MDEHAGIDPYCLSDWYRYLSCGYFDPAVGGTAEMTAMTAVGTIRTYARIPDGRPFDYGAWMDAVRAGNTFVTYGPLMEFRVEGLLSGRSDHDVGERRERRRRVRAGQRDHPDDTGAKSW